MRNSSEESAVYSSFSRRRNRLIGLVGLMALVVAATFVPTVAHGAKKKGDVHQPPYKEGPSGGDEFNFIEADASSGNMAVLRTFPGVPPVVGCAPEPAAGWAMFQIKHDVKEPVSEVTLEYSAATDAYSWISVGARDEKGEWLGVKKKQGPLAGSGTLTAKLFKKPQRGDKITIEFGLQLGDACPQAGVASAMFPSVTVK